MVNIYRSLMFVAFILEVLLIPPHYWNLFLLGIQVLCFFATFIQINKSHEQFDPYEKWGNFKE